MFDKTNGRLAMRCNNCGNDILENAIIAWKCNSCDKAFKVTKEQLQNLIMKKMFDQEKSFLKCPTCKSEMDDGNENIVWKCTCGTLNKARLKDFEETEDILPINSSLINCPNCGMSISSKAKKCVHCGELFYQKQSTGIVCPDCKKEVPIGMMECPNCGCPIEENLPKAGYKVNIDINMKRIVVSLIVIALLCVIGIAVYNIKIVRPKKVEAQNKEVYEEAVALLEKGKYEDGNELLQTITGYKDVDTILEQIKWESYTYECINDFRTWLKNPDSFTLYEVAFYLDDEPHGLYGSLVGEVDYSYPAIVFRSGGQNGFGGNTTGYELFYYFKDEGYMCVGSCDSLDEDEYYNDKGELKDEEDGAMDVLLCKEINELKEEAEQVGEVDMDRLKSIIKNDSYSTIRIIE